MFHKLLVCLAFVLFFSIVRSIIHSMGENSTSVTFYFSITVNVYFYKSVVLRYPAIKADFREDQISKHF